MNPRQIDPALILLCATLMSIRSNAMIRHALIDELAARFEPELVAAVVRRAAA